MYLGEKIRRKKKIIELFNEQSGLCYYCKMPMTLDLGHWNTATKDHVVPRSAGGPTQNWNLVASCYFDNQRKGSLSEKKYKKMLSRVKQVPVQPEAHPEIWRPTFAW